ncbi:MAG: DUF2240 family protein [Thermoplasmata archaeon]
MSELRKSIAVLYKSKGREELTEKEFVFSASMDLRWFSPKEAQKLMEAGLSGGFLERRNGSLVPTFDFAGVTVPVDYKPPKAALEEYEKKTTDFFTEIVEAIVKAKSVPKREVVSKVNREQELLGIDIEPAALLVASSYGIRLESVYLERAESAVLGRDMVR